MFLFACDGSFMQNVNQEYLETVFIQHQQSDVFVETLLLLVFFAVF